MTLLLVSDYGSDAKVWRHELTRYPDAPDLKAWPDFGRPDEVEVIFIDTVMDDKGGYGQFPNLKWVCYLGHGAGDVLKDSSLGEGIIITRLVNRYIVQGVTEYIVHAVTNHHLRRAEYEALQARCLWNRLAVRPSEEISVAVLGLGSIGSRAATVLCDLSFGVSGWSASPKNLNGIESRSGPDALADLLSRSDYVVCALPETSETIGLFDRTTLGLMKRGAFLINVGRGSLIVAEDLIAAIDRGNVSGAQLDVTAPEPLPVDSPLWCHPKVIVTPHTGGTSSGNLSIKAAVENYGRFQAKQPLNHLVDRVKGY